MAGLDTARVIRTAEELKSYARYLLSFLVKVMRAVVPLHRSLSYLNPWWCPQVGSIVREA